MVVSLYLVLCSCLLSGWWLLPGFLGMSQWQLLLSPVPKPLPALGFAVTVRKAERGIPGLSGSWVGGWHAHLTHQLVLPLGLEMWISPDAPRRSSVSAAQA